MLFIGLRMGIVDCFPQTSSGSRTDLPPGRRIMLTLPIKKKWFDMILSGEKKEEYREIKQYWIIRLAKELGYINLATFRAETEIFLNDIKSNKYMGVILAKFRNGYGSNVPSFIAYVTISVGTGEDKWGAEKGKQYFVLTIHGITEIGHKADKAAGQEIKNH